MTQLEKLKDNKISYHLLWWFIYLTFKRVYRRMEYYGKENLRADVPIIIAPNHSNTLMDAMAALFSTRRLKIYVARADVFKKPFVIELLTFLKILPINRMRDGVRNLSKNEEINDMVVDILHNRLYFCIFPEGTHQMKHSLLPLGKGICRIALQANSIFGRKQPLYIVPMGVEYGHFTRFRSSMLVQAGEPFNVTEFIENHSHLETPDMINALKEAVAIRMKEKILYIPNDENYEGTLELCHLWSGRQKERLQLRGKPLLNRFLSAKQTLSDISHYLQDQPEEAKKLIADATLFSIERHKKGIRIPSMHRRNPKRNLLFKSLLLIVGLPYFAVAAVVSSPATLLAERLCSKAKDPAFHNSIRFLVASFFYPLYLLVIFVLFLAFLPWWWALAAIAAALPSLYYTYDYLRGVRMFISDVKWLKNKELREKLRQFEERFTKKQ